MILFFFFFSKFHSSTLSTNRKGWRHIAKILSHLFLFIGLLNVETTIMFKMCVKNPQKEPNKPWVVSSHQQHVSCGIMFGRIIWGTKCRFHEILSHWRPPFVLMLNRSAAFPVSHEHFPDVSPKSHAEVVIHMGETLRPSRRTLRTTAERSAWPHGLSTPSSVTSSIPLQAWGWWKLREEVQQVAANIVGRLQPVVFSTSTMALVWRAVKWPLYVQGCTV